MCISVYFLHKVSEIFSETLFNLKQATNQPTDRVVYVPEHHVLCNENVYVSIIGNTLWDELRIFDTTYGRVACYTWIDSLATKEVEPIVVYNWYV